MLNPPRAKPSDLVEATMFKGVGNRFVLRAPGIWPFLPARHYLVDQAEKDAILENLKRQRLRGVLLAFGVWLLLVAAAGTSMALLTGHDDPTTTDFVVLFVFTTVSLILCLQGQTVLALRPVTVGLAETSERFPFRERYDAARSAVRNATPFRQPLLLAVCYSIACAANTFALLAVRHGTPRHFGLNDGRSFSALFLAMLFGGLAVRFFYLDFAGSKPSADPEVAADAGTLASSLTLRIEQVESETRRLRRALASVAALACALGVGAAATVALTTGGVTHSAEADRFILRDANGGIAALLATGKDNAAALSLYGPDKKLRMFLGLTSTGEPQLAFYGPDQGLRLVLGVASDGLPVLRLNGANAKLRVGLVVNSNDSWLTLSEPGGKTRLSLSADPAGGHIRVLDAEGKEQGRQ